MEPNGATEVVAVVQVSLLPNGQVNVQAKGPNPLMLLGMLDMARAQMLEQMKKPASPIQVAPAGLRFPN